MPLGTQDHAFSEAQRPATRYSPPHCAGRKRLREMQNSEPPRRPQPPPEINTPKQPVDGSIGACTSCHREARLNYCWTCYGVGYCSRDCRLRDQEEHFKHCTGRRPSIREPRNLSVADLYRPTHTEEPTPPQSPRQPDHNVVRSIREPARSPSRDPRIRRALELAESKLSSVQPQTEKQPSKPQAQNENGLKVSQARVDSNTNPAEVQTTPTQSTVPPWSGPKHGQPTRVRRVPTVFDQEAVGVLTVVVGNPFTCLKRQAWLEDRPASDIGELLTDTYRFRFHLNEKHEGRDGEILRTTAQTSTVISFSNFLARARAADLVPTVFTFDMIQELVQAFRISRHSSSAPNPVGLNAEEIEEKYIDGSMPVQMMIFADQIMGVPVVARLIMTEEEQQKLLLFEEWVWEGFAFHRIFARLKNF